MVFFTFSCLAIHSVDVPKFKGNILILDHFQSLESSK